LTATDRRYVRQDMGGKIPHARFELAGCAPVGYRSAVLRRCASLCALLAVVTAPSVTSTRFFCRFTGQEILGCDEGAPRNAQVRPDDCCERRILRAVAAVRHSEHEVLPVAQAVAAAIPTPGAAPALARESVVLRRTPASSAGPPAFLAHKALLI
jgi:hypothetical protein